MYIMKMPKAKVLRGKVFAQLDLVRVVGERGNRRADLCVFYTLKTTLSPSESCKTLNTLLPSKNLIFFRANKSGLKGRQQQQLQHGGAQELGQESCKRQMLVEGEREVQGLPGWQVVKIPSGKEVEYCWQLLKRRMNAALPYAIMLLLGCVLL